MDKKRLRGMITVVSIVLVLTTVIGMLLKAGAVPGDTEPFDNCVSDQELLAYIDLWSNGEVDDLSVLQAIDNNALYQSHVCDWWPNQNRCYRVWNGTTAAIYWTPEEAQQAFFLEGARAFAHSKVIPVLKRCRPNDYETYFASKCRTWCPGYMNYWRPEFSERIAMEVWYHATHIDLSPGVLGFNEWFISDRCPPFSDPGD